MLAGDVLSRTLPRKATTASLGLEPLADQQLAGVIMWIPAGALYVVVGLALMVAWVRATEREDAAL